MSIPADLFTVRVDKEVSISTLLHKAGFVYRRPCVLERVRHLWLTSSRYMRSLVREGRCELHTSVEVFLTSINNNNKS
jgi:hypothetical protein